MIILLTVWKVPYPKHIFIKEAFQDCENGACLQKKAKVSGPSILGWGEDPALPNMVEQAEGSLPGAQLSNLCNWLILQLGQPGLQLLSEAVTCHLTASHNV